jgi:hypothetical protein
MEIWYFQQRHYGTHTEISGPFCLAGHGGLEVSIDRRVKTSCCTLQTPSMEKNGMSISKVCSHLMSVMNYILALGAIVKCRLEDTIFELPYFRSVASGTLNFVAVFQD